MKITSSAFEEGDSIPTLYTCEGENINPPLEIHHAPLSAKSLVLILDDPDVPASVRPDRMYDHWIVYNIPPDTRHIPANTVPHGKQGKNTAGKNAYIGPCPPDRQHRYFFKLYALDKHLDLHEGATKKEVEKAMEGHVIEECRLMGLYEKKNLT